MNFNWKTQNLFRFVSLLLTDGSFRADRSRLQNGETGGADGTLNWTDKAWVNFARRFCDTSVHFANYCADQAEELAKLPWVSLASDYNLESVGDNLGAAECEGVGTDLDVDDQATFVKKLSADESDTALWKRLGEKCRMKWRDIKTAYSKVHTKWSASGQQNLHREINDFIMFGCAESTPNPLVIKYLHLIVFQHEDMINFATKTIPKKHQRDEIPSGHAGADQSRPKKRRASCKLYKSLLQVVLDRVRTHSIFLHRWIPENCN